jgi:hypothetical protein
VALSTPEKAAIDPTLDEVRPVTDTLACDVPPATFQ